MERPKKKDKIHALNYGYNLGSNQAYDVWEAYHKHIMKANNTCPIALLDKTHNQCQARQEIQRLQDKLNSLPSEEEIEKILKNKLLDAWCGHGGPGEDADVDLKLLAKAIHKRLGGSNE